MRLLLLFFIAQFLVLTNSTPLNTSLLIRQQGGGSSTNRVAVQDRANRELLIISQPPAISPVRALANYAFPAAAGRGINIFVLDSGVNPNHPFYEALEMRGLKPKWIWGSEPKGGKGKKEDWEGHGTCVASKAVSETWGAAKESQLWVVDRGPSVASIHVALRKIYDRVKNGKMRGKAIVNMSFSHESGTREEYNLLYNLIAEGVVLVTASGNDADIPGMEDIDEYLALYAGPNTIHIPGDNNDLPPLPIIVVGATDNYGRKIPWSQGDRSTLTTSAPGNNIKCASHEGSKERVLFWGYKVKPGQTKVDGTSLAAPAVAGMIAVELSDNPTLRNTPAPEKHEDGWIVMETTTAHKVKEWVQSNHYIRGTGDIEMIWNGHSGELSTKHRYWSDVTKLSDGAVGIPPTPGAPT